MVTLTNTTWNQSIVKTSECVCDIVQRCIESDSNQSRLRTDRMYSVCEMLIENKALSQVPLAHSMMFGEKRTWTASSPRPTREGDAVLALGPMLTRSRVSPHL